jgi:hypothetical protein
MGKYAVFIDEDSVVHVFLYNSVLGQELHALLLRPIEREMKKHSGDLDCGEYILVFFFSSIVWDRSINIDKREPIAIRNA